MRNKRIKGFLAGALIGMMAVSGGIGCGNVYAEKIGDTIGSVYNTDIVAYINNYAVPSYAANGTSVIVAEDLRNFGFDVEWDNASRSLNITRNRETDVHEMSVRKTGLPNTRFADLLYTDIEVYADGVKLPSYAINGYTMIPIESLTVFGEVYWVQEERAVKLWVDGLHIRGYKQNVEPAMADLTGEWTTSSDPYSSIVIYAQDGNKLNMYFESSNSRGTRIATATVKKAVFSGNECSFRFEDSYGYYGTGHMQLSGDGIYLTYPTVNGSGGWSITSGGNMMYYKSKTLDQIDYEFYPD